MQNNSKTGDKGMGVVDFFMSRYLTIFTKFFSLYEEFMESTDNIRLNKGY